MRLQENKPTRILKDEIIATTINVSRSGACLILPKIFLNGVHLFFSTLRDDTHSLILHYGVNNPDPDKDFTVNAQSIWMDSLDSEEEGGFKVGVRFTDRQDDLYKSLKKSTKV